MICEFCGFEFDYEGSLGRYGCPNCLAEGLERRGVVKIPAGMVCHSTLDEVRLTSKRIQARFWMHGNKFAWAMNKRLKAYFNAKLRDPCAILPYPQ